MPTMRIHILGLVHRDPNSHWEPDAYVGKLWRICRILTGLGHEVVFYGGPDSQVDASEIVQVIGTDDRRSWFGDETWDNRVFNEFDPTHPSWLTINRRVIDAVRERLGSRDVIGLTMGTAQASIAAAFPAHVVAEVGVGYEGVLPDTHRCYESEAWRHYLWGKHGVTNGRWYDTVIPNSYDPADYTFSADKSDFLLFMGRLTTRKGLEVVSELAKRHRVVTAGQGDPIPGVEHIGVLRGAEKAALLAEARAVLVPTFYIEPFGGVAVEAMLSGTPVITSPFGAFSETVGDAVSGYRCHTISEFLSAAVAVGDLDPKEIREHAMARYTLDAASRQYDAWLARLAGLYDRGWYG